MPNKFKDGNYSLNGAAPSYHEILASYQVNGERIDVVYLEERDLISGDDWGWIDLFCGATCLNKKRPWEREGIPTKSEVAEYLKG